MLFQDFANQFPEFVLDALLKCGINEDEVMEMLIDFRTDSYWNDPKNVSRRIRLQGGCQADFYDYCVAKPDWN
jgi:hypothetical protein